MEFGEVGWGVEKLEYLAMASRNTVGLGKTTGPKRLTGNEEFQVYTC